ncbi:hypothetical protein [Sediminicoccus sp. BL-A-41-H5]|uniref:DUF7946 domain-containing protein n=1 Tax=Sediminicoccus sp. BL-A-41-H5 TaxID=3421106 RepID=UPI003D67EF18
MSQIEFTYSYKPIDGSHELSAYDASQALYGIARSLAITSHYVIHNKVIKQAPSLRGAQVFIRPPKAGSFEFVAPVVELIAGGQAAGAVGASTFSINYLSDLTRYLYRRATGLAEIIETQQLRDLLRRRPGDVDALSEAIIEDVVRLHRPVGRKVPSFNVYDPTRQIGNFDKETQDYANTKVVDNNIEEYSGNVSSFNVNETTGRFYITKEERTVAFQISKKVQIPREQRQLLSWSLSEYDNARNGYIILRGRSLKSRQGLLKTIFVTEILEPPD